MVARVTIVKEGKLPIKQGQEARSRFVRTQRAFPVAVATQEAIIECNKPCVEVPDLSGGFTAGNNTSNISSFMNTNASNCKRETYYYVKQTIQEVCTPEMEYKLVQASVMQIQGTWRTLSHRNGIATLEGSISVTDTDLEWSSVEETGGLFSPAFLGVDFVITFFITLIF